MDDHGDDDRERLLQLQQLTDDVLAAALNRLDAEVRHNLAEWVR